MQKKEFRPGKGRHDTAYKDAYKYSISALNTVALRFIKGISMIPLIPSTSRRCKWQKK